jgi:hypothetical protein
MELVVDGPIRTRASEAFAQRRGFPPMRSATLWRIWYKDDRQLG